MRITKDQTVAGHPAMKVRDFLRKYRLGAFIAPAAEEVLRLKSDEALKFLHDLVNLGLLDASISHFNREELWFHVTDMGQSFANASAAKPISRQTAERTLREFMERVQQANANDDYIYRIESVVLFGSMLGDGERLGDVDVAIELVAKTGDEQQFQELSESRRHFAQENGRRFQSIFDWAVWPMKEIFLFLKSRSRSLSLHPLSELKGMTAVRYRVLLGSPDRLATQIPAGRQLSAS